MSAAKLAQLGVGDREVHVGGIELGDRRQQGLLRLYRGSFRRRQEAVGPATGALTTVNSRLSFAVSMSASTDWIAARAWSRAAAHRRAAFWVATCLAASSWMRWKFSSACVASPGPARAAPSPAPAPPDRGGDRCGTACRPVHHGAFGVFALQDRAGHLRADLDAAKSRDPAGIWRVSGTSAVASSTTPTSGGGGAALTAGLAAGRIHHHAPAPRSAITARTEAARPIHTRALIGSSPCP